MNEKLFSDLENLEILCITRVSFHTINCNAFNGLKRLKELRLTKMKLINFHYVNISCNLPNLENIRFELELAVRKIIRIEEFFRHELSERVVSG